MPMILSQNDRVTNYAAGDDIRYTLIATVLLCTYGSCYFKSGLISPADAQSLGSSIGSTYYTPNVPFAVLKEVTNRIPTLLATSTGGRKLQNFDELNDLLSSITVILPQIEPFSVGVRVAARITGSRRALVASLHLKIVA